MLKFQDHYTTLIANFEETWTQTRIEASDIDLNGGVSTRILEIYVYKKLIAQK